MKEHKLGAVAPTVMALIAWLTWVALIIAEIVEISTSGGVNINGIYSVAWVFYIGFVTVITVARSNIRSIHGINGNPVEDFFAALFLYPCVMIQLETVNKPRGIAPLMPDNTKASEADVIKNFRDEESKA